jgi:hypothetical protein
MSRSHRWIVVWFSFVWIPLAVVLAVVMPSNIAETREFEGFAQRILGSWKSTEGSKVSVKTFHADGTYTETTRFLTASATVSGIYRIEGARLIWMDQKLTADRPPGHILPPTKHVRLNQEQRGDIRWNGADRFTVSGDLTKVYRRLPDKKPAFRGEPD